MKNYNLVIDVMADKIKSNEATGRIFEMANCRP